MYVAITGSGKARVIQFREDVRIPNTKKKKTNVIKTTPIEIITAPLRGHVGDADIISDNLLSHTASGVL